MAEAEFGTHADEAVRGDSINTPINLVGAALSLSLIAGLAVWSYDLAVRDVSGVPVVKALEGPMRVRPEDPGGEPAAHQGLAVNQVPADGGAAAPTDQVVLAPRPVEITEQDLLPREEPEPVDVNEAVASALAEVDLSEIVDVSTSGVEIDIPPGIPGTLSSPRPLWRPASRVRSSEATIAPNVDVSADTIEAGTRLVQLGAYETPEEAREKWSSLIGNFDAYFAGRQRVIQEATSGGRTFYRLRVLGFEDLADARRFCSVLLVDDLPCIPVVSR